MRLPGRAWLEFEVSQVGQVSRIRQTAVFEPSGVAGRLYWYGIYPLHALVFGGMLRGIVRAVANRNLDGVRLPQPLRMGEAQLQRRGAGLLRERWVQR